MQNLVPNEKEKKYIEEIASKIRNSGKFDFEFGHVQFRDLIRFIYNPNTYNIEFEVVFRKFKPRKKTAGDYFRQRYFAETHIIERIIALNIDLSFLDLPFTLAHEVGHIMLGHRPSHIYKVWREMELQANYFAYCLLMPEKEFIQLAYNYDFHLGSLSEHFCCPIERIMKRLVMLFDGTQYISLRNGGARFLLSKYCKNPNKSKSLEIDGKKINKNNINMFLEKHKIPRNPRSYFRCKIRIEDSLIMFKFHTRYDIFQNIEILGFGYDMEKKYEVVTSDPNRRSESPF